MAFLRSQKPSDPIIEAAEKGVARESFFSFGDEGLTASVGATGRLLRITQHFLGQRTGICVDDESTPVPYYASSRLGNFLACSLNERLGGLGPRLDILCHKREAECDIVNDRWPSFSRPIGDDISTNLRVSYIASQGTIYQKFEIVDMQGKESEIKKFDDKALDELWLASRLLIRDLDFVSEDNAFNNDTLGDGIIHGSHIVWKHESQDKPFVLHLQVLDQHSTVEFCERRRGSDYYHIRRKSNNSEQSVSKIVFAYTLRQGLMASDLKPLPDWKEFLKADRLLQRYPIVKLTDNDVLDIFFRRNLEYVLSVCSIPVSDGGSDGVPAYALTCGDVDSHRVTSAASFYAFQFLLLGLDRFNSLHSEQQPDCACDYAEKPLPSAMHLVCTMKRRIELVCEGHIKWIFQRAMSSEGNPKLFCPNYWTNGDEIDNWESNEWLPAGSLVDTPFQFIKAADFYKRLDRNMPSKLIEMVNPAYQNWMHHLRNIEKSDKYAFPSYKTFDNGEPSKTFYLTDHALIWQAIKSAESMNLKVMSADPGQAERYSANRMRENIVKRFTTENPVLKNRMIAIKRSPNQNRFLFRSKDVALFRAMEEGLFENAETQWENVLDCQKNHRGNDDTDWSDPRRFALAITMAQHGKSINLRTRQELTEQALSVLLGSTSFNGLFTGTLDERRGPAVYEDERHRDNYWTVVFEVPYILWKNDCSQVIRDRSDDTMSTEGIPEHLGDLIVHQVEPTGLRYRYGYWTNHDFPFNNVMDDNNIIELQDEWLYNEPAFFNNITNASMIGQLKDSTNLEIPITVPANLADFRLMIDIPEHHVLKQKRSLRKFEAKYFSPNEGDEFKDVARSPRDSKTARKRFWAFVSSEAEKNSSCTDTFVPHTEGGKTEMLRFFDRHKSSSNFFLEKTILALNIWTTEFQVAFYSGICTSKTTYGVWPGWSTKRTTMGFRFEGDMFDRYWTCHFVVTDPQMPAEVKLKGDLINFLEQNDTDKVSSYDEVKTGPWEERRILELMLFGRFVRRMASSADQIQRLAEISVNCTALKIDLWRFRLEGIEIHDQEEIESVLAAKDVLDGISRIDASDGIDYRTFLIISNRLRSYQVRLREIHGDFAEVRAIITQWLDREKDRQAERPRWTFSDESRYRSKLNDLLVANNRGIQDLERNLAKISSLAESITARLEYMRNYLEVEANDQSQRNNKDIKLFTYTTAVFLPLGFATGMFSMSGTPDAQTVGSMFGLFGGVLIVGTLIILCVTKKVDLGDLFCRAMMLLMWGSTSPASAVRSIFKLRGKEKGGASTNHGEGLVEEGRGELGFTVDETAASGSGRSFNG